MGMRTRQAATGVTYRVNDGGQVEVDVVDFHVGCGDRAGGLRHLLCQCHLVSRHLCLPQLLTKQPCGFLSGLCLSQTALGCGTSLQRPLAACLRRTQWVRTCSAQQQHMVMRAHLETLLLACTLQALLGSQRGCIRFALLLELQPPSAHTNTHAQLRHPTQSNPAPPAVPA